MKLFEDHPLPWTVGVANDAECDIMDANECSFFTVTHTLPGSEHHSSAIADSICKQIYKMCVAIQRALDDEESGGGWGPDVTVCDYLREALK